MPQGCGVTDCNFGADPGLSYEKGHEILVRHLMAHQVNETRRVAEALERLMDPPQWRVAPGGEPFDATPGKAVLLSPQETLERVHRPNGATEPAPGTATSGNCPDCGHHRMSLQHRTTCEVQVPAGG